MNSKLQINFRDYTTWVGIFGFVSTVAFSIPHPIAHTVGQISAGIATAIMTAFTNNRPQNVQPASATPEELLKAGRE